MDLSTTYLGLQLAHPVVSSAGPLTATVDGVRALADGGASAVVLHSLFEEELRTRAARDAAIMDRNSDAFAESLDYFPDVQVSTQAEARSYLSLVERASAAVDVPVIASLNGSDIGGWTGFARQLQDAGAAAVELNIYLVPGDVFTDGSEVVLRHREIVRAVCDAVDIPVSVKLSPHFTSPGHMALTLLADGAAGLVLFNRFLQPDVNVDDLSTDVGFDLSAPHEGRLPRTWIAALRGHTRASLAGSTGVETADDVVRYVLAGADVVMTTSSLVRNGPAHAGTLAAGLEEWLVRKGFDSLGAARGMLAVPGNVDADAHERGGYVQAIQRAKERYGAL